ASGALDVATASTFCASTTCVVDELYDQTGDGFNLLQSDGRFQPALAFNCIGSLPCLSFAPTGGSGGNPQFITSVATTSQSKPITYSVVAERTGDVTSVGPILFDQNGAGWLQFNNVANQLCAYGGGSCLTATATDTAMHAIQVVFSTSTASSVTVDGALTTGNPGTQALSNTTFEIGSGNGNNLDGYITEAGVWPIGF